MADKFTRKLTTILAADVEGYSRLMRADEEATLETLTGYRSVLDGLIAQQNGRIFSTGGDSILVEFASPVEAVRCALAWQQELTVRNAQLSVDRKVSFRIGINVGDVVQQGNDLFGDGVNVAARLEGLAEAGGVCISGSVYEQVRHKFSLDFEDVGEQHVKNIAEPITVYRLSTNEAAATKSKIGHSKTGGKRLWLVPALVAALVALTGVVSVWLWQPWSPKVEPASAARMAFPLPDKPSIAVLPFTNLGDDASQEYFADGMTDDLITDLSKIPDLFVIARNTVFTYKSRSMKVGQVAEELGVRYVLEGSVRRAGEQVRINAQLIDATTGGHLWAERYDGTMSNVFDLQDSVTQQIVTALSLELTAMEASEGTAPETGNTEAYDIFLRGWEHYRLDTPDHYAKALKYFKDATVIDPGYGRAWAAMASIHWKSYIQDWAAVLGLESTEARRQAQEILTKVEGEQLPLAYQVKSQVALWRGRYEEATRAAEQAVALDSSNTDSQVVLAEALIYGGKPEEGLALIEGARRHDPNNEARYSMLQGLGEFNMARFADAVDSFRRTLELNPTLWNPEHQLGNAYCKPCVMLIASLGHLGRIEEADQLITRFKDQWSGFSIGTEYFLWPFKLGEDMERFKDGLQKAGVAE